MAKEYSLKQYALSYAKLGFAVFPVQAKGKAPATKNGFKDATKDPRIIQSWWDKADYNIGIATGSVSGGLVVVDIDIDKDKGIYGDDSLRDWEIANGKLPDTCRAITGRGGNHLYYRSKEKMSCKAGLLPGVDFRADGGYIVAPPSQHENGRYYEWEQAPNEFEIKEADDTVQKLLADSTDDSLNKPTFSLPDDIPQGSRNRTLFELACSLQSKGLSDESIELMVMNENERRCNPPLSDKEMKELKVTIRSALNYDKGHLKISPSYSDEARVKSILNQLNEIQPHIKYSLNDKGNGELFADLHKDCCRYNVTAGEWYIYNGMIWIEDTRAMTTSRYAKSLADALLTYATTIRDDSSKKVYIEHVLKLGSYQKRVTMLNDARDKFFINNDNLDKDIYLFNCLNGTMNLKTFVFKEHSPDDLLSKVSNVVYDPQAKSQAFEKFISDIMLDRKDLIKYLKKILGYSLTGDTKEETCYILYGSSTRNGKSTLVETIAYMMGNTQGYALNMKPETLAMRQNNDGRQASGDIARLCGCRFLNASEPPKRMIFDIGLLKTLLGRDTITARFIHQREFEFIPRFKLFINTNFLPLISDDTLFTSGRINVIPFNRHFSPKEQDKALKNKLISPDNMSGIFNWCLEGLKEYYLEGSQPPIEVIEATGDYRISSDKVGNFISECLIESPGENSKAKDIYERYQYWCKANGYGAENKGNFFAELRAKDLLKATGTVNGITVKNIVPGYKVESCFLSVSESDYVPFYQD